MITGLSVIENDFHKRPDKAPNICAAYVKKEYRRKGIARSLLDHACKELAAPRDYGRLSDHRPHGVYERRSWEFYGKAKENDGAMVRMYHRKTGRPQK